MTQASQPVAHWQIWVVAKGDYLRTNTGALHLFTSVDEAKRRATEVGGIVQIEGSPGLGGFDRALS